MQEGKHLSKQRTDEGSRIYRSEAIWFEPSKGKKLKSIVIPNSVTFISDYVFDDCSKDLIITTSKGSYAERYARENGMKIDLI